MQLTVPMSRTRTPENTDLKNNSFFSSETADAGVRMAFFGFSYRGEGTRRATSRSEFEILRFGLCRSRVWHGIKCGHSVATFEVGKLELEGFELQWM